MHASTVIISREVCEDLMGTRKIKPGWFYRCTGILRILSCILAVITLWKPSNAFAKSSLPEDDAPGERVMLISERYTRYDWWLVDETTNLVTCNFETDHESLPTAEEVSLACKGEEIPEAYYLMQISSSEATREVEKHFDLPTISFSVSGCKLTGANKKCDDLPTLIFTAEEPMPEHYITGIKISADNKSTICNANSCLFKLFETGMQGAQIEFQATSSLGDKSDNNVTRVRVIAVEKGTAQLKKENQSWYVDILSDQWKGGAAPGCAWEWDIFPPIGNDTPEWLSTPNSAVMLASDEPYYYLAGGLIRSGLVDGSKCNDNGLHTGDVANTCGLNQARQKVTEWQNSFDQTILNSAEGTGVPAHLIKKLFAQESQFWPGNPLWGAESGLGHLTPNGADTIFLWNTPFYELYCPSILSQEACKRRYLELTDYEKGLLQGALVGETNALCSECPSGIDVDKTNFSVQVFAEAMLANCTQTRQLLENVTDKPINQLAAYDDLWKLTLANYNVGAGCLSEAAAKTEKKKEAINWFNVSQNLSQGCQTAKEYVSTITQSQTSGVQSW